MTETTTAPAPETPEQAAARSLAEAKRLHQEAITTLQPLHNGALAKLDDLRAHLAASLEKAKTDASHLNYAHAFIRDVGLKVDEIVAWMKRTL